MNNSTAISEHISDINELRKTIAYCEGRILRKQIAIEEMRLGLEISEPATCAISQTDTPPNPGPSVRAMVEGILPQLTGRTFWYSDLKTICLTGFPEYENKIRHGIYPAVHELVKARKIFRTVNGLTTTAPA